MKSPGFPFRRWLIPLGLVAVAAALTVPWSFWVIEAAFDRDVMSNAKSLGLSRRAAACGTRRGLDEARDAGCELSWKAIRRCSLPNMWTCPIIRHLSIA